MAILAIGAHPDDIEFGCYATLAKLRKTNDIFFIVFTNGERGGPKHERILETQKSAKIIKANLEILDYPDGNIPVNPKTIDHLAKKIVEINPDTVFTLYPLDSHQDHRAVSKITISASKNIKRILFYEVPQTERCFSPNYFHDITDYFKFKKEALNCHKTQRNKPYLDIDEIKGLAQYRAYQCFAKGRLFEAFEVYRLIE